jgi:hypothetical protein
MQLHVRVVEARGLAKLDTIGMSDPFVVLGLAGSKTVFKTAIKDNTLIPVWNEEFRFPLNNPPRQAPSLLVRDHDVAFDDDMARLELPLAPIPIGRVVDQWYDLTPVKGVKVGGGRSASCFMSGRRMRRRSGSRHCRHWARHRTRSTCGSSRPTGSRRWIRSGRRTRIS